MGQPAEWWQDQATTTRSAVRAQAYRQSRSQQWLYKQGKPTRQALTSTFWNKARSSAGWPKASPATKKMIGASVQAIHSNRTGRVIGGSSAGYCIIESADGERWTCAPGGLTILGTAAPKPRRVNAKDAEIQRLRARVIELEAMILA